MVRIQQGLLGLAALFAPLLLGASAHAPIFFPDDPIQKMPQPAPVSKPVTQKVDQPRDFVLNSIRWQRRPPVPAGAINTMGDAPDSAWFTNRHASHRLTRAELQRGPRRGRPPTAPFVVVGGKTEGITPGFRMEDAEGRLYFVKVDPMSNPEMATAADVIVSRFLYAIGYNVPENDIVIGKSSDFRLSEKAQLSDEGGHPRKMTARDFEDIVKAIPHYRDASFRLVASRKIDGDSVGPFYYTDVRADDPNDIVPHQNRRDLRGLFVFFAWLNDTDARAANTYDTLTKENGIPFIKHYLLDFGSALGSDGDSPKDARLGHGFMIATPQEALRSIFTLGILPRSWERTHYPDLPAAGNFNATAFEPDDWKSEYPNPAFLSRLPDDDFWAARQVMAFSDDDIRAVVETGQFSDPRAVDYLTATLAKRRDKIGEAFFSKVLPLDNFRVEHGQLQFDDLAVRYRFREPQNYEVRWFQFNNMTGQRTRIPADASSELPSAVQEAAAGSYFSAVIASSNDDLKPMILTLVKTGTGYRVVGCSRFEISDSGHT